MKLVAHRPATALSSHEEITLGMTLWHTHFCYGTPETYVVTRAPYIHRGFGWWFGSTNRAYSIGHSCADCSLDGHDYNGNYLFRSEADALAWLEETWPIYRGRLH